MSRSATQPAPVRHVFSLTAPEHGAWRMTLDPADEGQGLGFSVPDLDDRTWCPVDLPISFDRAFPTRERYEGVGWVRGTFRVPAGWSAQRAVVRFLGVNNQCQVWLNGQLVGENADAHLPFELPVTHALHADAPNVLAVRVDNTRRPDTLPGVGLGWHPYGGVLREVELEGSDPLHIVAPPHIVLGAPETDGLFRALLSVRNDRPTPVTVQVSLTALDAEHASCATPHPQDHASLTLAPGEERCATLECRILPWRAWSPADPALYTAVVRIQSDGTWVDEQRARFGFRWVAVQDGQLRLNGQPLFLVGFNRHEDSPTHDMCPDPALLRTDLTAIKAMGCNFVRLCHYPHHPAELDLCDELGLLAMGEIPLYWWKGQAGGAQGAPHVLQTAQRQMQKLIRRDWNHPAVIFWSVSNECHTQHPDVVAGNAALLQRVRELDPTRLAVHVSDHWNASHGRQDRFEADDVVCVNSYPDPATGATYWATELARLHQSYPTKPILVTEFGQEDARQAPSLRAAFDGTRLSYVCGLVIWCWADHRWPVELAPYSHYGVLTRDRRPKEGFALAREGFRQRMAHELRRQEGA